MDIPRPALLRCAIALCLAATTSVLAVELTVEDGSTALRPVASNNTGAGTWFALAQSFLATDARVRFGFRLSDMDSRLPSAGRPISYNLYAGYTRKLATRTVVMPGVMSSDSRAVFGDVGFVNAPDNAPYASEDLLFQLASAEHIANDFNADGHSDILWRNGSTGANALWLSARADAQQPVRGVGDTDWQMVGTGDFDGDGRSDILWRHAGTGRNVIWRSGNPATVQAVASVVHLSWHVAGVADFDGDGRDDILWHHATSGASAIWLGADKSVQLPTRTVRSTAWKIVATGDFDADGRADILWRQDGTGYDALWLGADGNAAVALPRVSPAWVVAGVGDFDGDAATDILWRNPSNGAGVLWPAADATRAVVMTPFAPEWQLAATGDYDGDGVADLLWRNTVTGANVIWRSALSTDMQPVMGVPNQAWQVQPYADPPPAPGQPALGAHALVWQEDYVAPPQATTPPLASAPHGSSFLAVVGGFGDNAVAPVDNLGNRWRQFGQPVVFHGYDGAFDTRAYLALDGLGGPDHVVTVAKPLRPDREISVVLVEARNAPRLVDAAQVYAEQGTLLTSGTVTTDGPALLVALWWGDSDAVQHVALPDNGFRVIDQLTTLPPNSASAVQCAVAVREVARAGTYQVSWTTAPAQGAILWLFAFGAAQPMAGNRSSTTPSAIG